MNFKGKIDQIENLPSSTRAKILKNNKSELQFLRREGVEVEIKEEGDYVFFRGEFPYNVWKITKK